MDDKLPQRAVFKILGLPPNFGTVEARNFKLDILIGDSKCVVRVQSRGRP